MSQLLRLGMGSTTNCAGKGNVGLTSPSSHHDIVLKPSQNRQMSARSSLVRSLKDKLALPLLPRCF